MTLLLLLGAIAASLFVLVALRAALAGPLHAPRYWLIPPRTGGPVLAASKQIVFVLLGAVAAYLSAAVLFTCQLRLGVVDSAAPHDTVIDVIPGRPAEAAGSATATASSGSATPRSAAGTRSCSPSRHAPARPSRSSSNATASAGATRSASRSGTAAA